MNTMLLIFWGVSLLTLFVGISLSNRDREMSDFWFIFGGVSLATTIGMTIGKYAFAGVA